MEFKNINSSPVKCFRWLKVNDITIDVDYDSSKKFTNKFVDYKEQKGLNLTEYKCFLNEKITGVSEEINGIIENKYNNGFSLVVDENISVCEPIRLSFKFDENNSELFEIGEIIAKENSKVTIYINYSANTNIATKRLGILKIKSYKNSEINIVKTNTIENSIESIIVNEDENSVVNIISIDLAKKNNITNYLAKLTGNNSKNSYQTAYIGQNNDVLDFTFKIDHIGKNTQGFMDTRGILQDSAIKTLRNAINFEKGAKKAVGSESEYVMILSPNVLNNSIPLLLCTEDDVSGEHGAGIGRIDDAVMFYLMSRGLSYEESKKLLIQGYLNPIIDKINDDSVKTFIYKEIDKRTEK